MDDAARTRRRTINDGRRRLFSRERQIAFVCECGEETCARTVVLSAPEYDAVRRRGGELLAHRTRMSL